MIEGSCDECFVLPGRPHEPKCSRRPYHVPDLSQALPLPAAFVWCAACGAAVDGCEHRGFKT